MNNYSRSPQLVLWAGVALVLCVLAIGLPDDAFFVGDSGVKLIAVRNALAHPLRPLDIDPPSIGGAPAPDLLDPFFVSHGSHAHAETAAIFPLISAPFYAVFGLRGLQVLPLLGFLVALAGLALMARRCGDRSPAAGMVAFGVASCPLFFYGLEFWEHSLGAALAYVGTGLFLNDSGNNFQHANGRAENYSRSRTLLSGVLLGAAVLTRPEAIWYLLALVAAVHVLVPRPRVADLFVLAAGVAAMLAPFAAANALHFHNFLGPHVSGNAGALEHDWLDARAAFLREWFLPTGWIGTLALSLAVGASLVGRLLPAAGGAARLVVLGCAAALGVVAATRGFPRESLWAVFPVAAMLFAPAPAPASRRDPHRAGIRFLLWLTLLDAALVVLTAPNDGGGQWGPRYLMLAAGPATLAVWLLIREIVTHRRTAEVYAVGLLIALSVLVQRQAYKELRAAKQHYSRLQQALFAETRGLPVLSDIWWLDQIAAARAPAAPFLFASDRAKAIDAVRRLAAAHVDSFAIVTEPGAAADAEIRRWLDGTAFRPAAGRELPDVRLAVYRIRASEDRPR